MTKRSSSHLNRHCPWTHDFVLTKDCILPTKASFRDTIHPKQNTALVSDDLYSIHSNMPAPSPSRTVFVHVPIRAPSELGNESDRIANITLYLSSQLPQ